MEFNKKRLLIDLLILVVPVIIMLLLTPVLPDKISIHKGLVNSYIDKKYSFVLGILPFVIYKLRFNKK